MNISNVDLLVDMSGSVLCFWTDAELPQRAKYFIDRIGDLDHRRLDYNSLPSNIRRSLRNAMFDDGPLRRHGGRERAIERILNKNNIVTSLVEAFD